ncbi:hypothetical protein M3651_28255, partial [Cytobacillus oceanisediminis]|nr:hypothetical protein [Cytobacillus oceanisediminis]
MLLVRACYAVDPDSSTFGQHERVLPVDSSSNRSIQGQSGQGSGFVGATSFDWKSTGDHPLFDLEPEERGETVPSGWVYVEARMMRRGAHLVARLYIDTGAGFSDAESI